jgi:hypothetical protein
MLPAPALEHWTTHHHQPMIILKIGDMIFPDLVFTQITDKPCVGVCNLAISKMIKNDSRKASRAKACSTHNSLSFLRNGRRKQLLVTNLFHHLLQRGVASGGSHDALRSQPEFTATLAML